MEIKQIPVKEIYPNPRNPRKEFSTASMEELVKSVKNVGVLQPVIVVFDDVKNMYRLVAGERRWRASSDAELETIPAIVRDVTEEQELEIMVVENLQRKDINPIEEAEGFKMMLDNLDYTQEQLAEKLGCSQAHIANRIRLLKLPTDIKEKISRKIISAGHGVQLVKINETGLCKKITEVIEKENVPVAETKNTIHRVIALEGKPLFDNYNDNPLFDLVGCEKCQHNKLGKAYYTMELSHYCVKVSCWNEKQEKAKQLKYEEHLKKVDSNNNEIVNLSKLNYNEYIEFDGYQFKVIDKADCEGCQYLKFGSRDPNSYDSANLYCFNISCFNKKKRAATIESNKNERQKRQKEVEKIGVWANKAVVEKITKREILWFAVMILSSVKNDQDRPTLYRYMKDRFGWEHEFWKSPWQLRNFYFNDAVDILSTLPEVNLIELIFEWPAIAEGLMNCNKYILGLDEEI
ncbi:ParB/RepB/Spo0J family partition protein [Peptococcaceae bacterium 1198_IL3148]